VQIRVVFEDILDPAPGIPHLADVLDGQPRVSEDHFAAEHILPLFDPAESFGVEADARGDILDDLADVDEQVVVELQAVDGEENTAGRVARAPTTPQPLESHNPI
jgi:hypothetical protein